MNQMSLCRLWAALVLLAASPDASLRAQQADRIVSRLALEARIRLLDSSAASPAYSNRTRARAQSLAAALRQRLEDGDFKVGDQIAVSVNGTTELLNDTLSVGDSLILELPGIRRVRLAGVLRSELPATLQREIEEVVRSPRIEARPLIRIAVLGEVGGPGFVAVTSTTLIDQLITQAGGPTAAGALDRMRVVRGDTVLLEGADVSHAIALGTTIGALDLRDGDALVVPPRRPPWDRASILQVASFLVTPLLTLLAVR